MAREGGRFSVQPAAIRSPKSQVGRIDPIVAIGA